MERQKIEFVFHFHLFGVSLFYSILIDLKFHKK